MTLRRRDADRDVILVTGSLAWDQIMDFPGQFKDHILPDKLHVINISFLIGDMRRQRGGCSGNIAYSLALLGAESEILAAAGSDFGPYRDFLVEHGIGVEGISIADDEVTACAFVTTDRSNSQITGFYVGAMPKAAELSVGVAVGERTAAVIVAPDDPVAMERHCREGREAGIPTFFDPSFQVTAMDGETLRRCATGCDVLLLNDYELAVFQDKTGCDDRSLFDLVDLVVVTLGADGSRLMTREGEERVAAVEVDEVVDPTGAGDAFRGGFLAGWVRDCELRDCARLGSLAAAYAIEKVGTQNHRYDLASARRRYQAAFGSWPSAMPSS